jgi:hypothetical protein
MPPHTNVELLIRPKRRALKPLAKLVQAPVKSPEPSPNSLPPTENPDALWVDDDNDDDLVMR